MKLTISAGSRSPIYVRVADAVSDALRAGSIAPGDQLPPHAALAKDLGVSPLTVSKGYELLRGRGIVRRRRGSGTYINSDALRYAQRTGKRRYGNIRCITGETSLAMARRETLFIAIDILDGIRDMLGQREAHFEFVKSFASDDLVGLSPDDAVLLFRPRHVDPTQVDVLARRGIPVMAVLNQAASLPIPHIDYDRQQAPRQACQHLVDCGYRRIGFIGVRSRLADPTPPKFLAFMTVLADAGLDVSACYVRHATVEPGAAYAAARQMIDSGDLPEALFVDTDYKAMEAIRALADAGLKVPEDVGIVSYDDIPEAADFTPALTTVRWPRRELGRALGRLLQEWPVDGKPNQPKALESDLVVRKSTSSHISVDNLPHVTSPSS